MQVTVQLVVWDVRSGRLPVQKSAWNLLGGRDTGTGTSSNVNVCQSHVHPIIGLESVDVSFFVLSE